MDELKITKSKAKLVPLGFVAVLFLVLGVSMLTTPEQFAGSLWNSLNLIRVLGGLSLVSFWVTMFLLVRRLTDQTPGLVLDKQGFTAHKALVRNVDKFAGETIPWQDIGNIRDVTLAKERFVRIDFIKDHAHTSSLASFLEADSKTGYLPEQASRPPFLLSAKELNMNFDELLAKFNQYHQAHLEQSKQ